jgi:hypothetical protein
MNVLLNKQDKLHISGTIILNEVLLPILNKYGKVIIGGSYTYNLLSHPDLDIDIVSENITKETFVALSAELLQLQHTSEFQSADRVNFLHKHPGKRPVGYWISPAINFEDSIWKIDIWLQKLESYTGDTNKYAQELLSLNDEKRVAILSLKEELLGKKIYGVGKEFLSVDVYEGVFRDNVRTIDDLRDFMSSRKQDF